MAKKNNKSNNTNNSNTRTFNWDDSIEYNGTKYPTTVMPITDLEGNVTDSIVFADANGKYYAINNGEATPVILQRELPELVVNSNSQQLGQRYAEALNRYVNTQGNDNTIVDNVSHRAYNPQITPIANAGARQYAAWAKAHPEGAAWGNALASIPFMVMTMPLLNGAASTAVGKMTTQGLTGLANAASNSTIFPFMDAAATSYFGAKALQDVQNNNISTETALNLLPLVNSGMAVSNAGRHLASNVIDYRNLKNFINRYGYNEYNPKLGLIFNDDKLDRLTNQLIRQHNTFTRGASVSEARQYYGIPNTWTDEEVAKHILTTPHVPNANNSGGNAAGLPVLYTSNSLDLAKTYADGNGYVGILQRPLIWNPDRTKRLWMNDFRFSKQNQAAPNYYTTTDEPTFLSKHKALSTLQRTPALKGLVGFKIRNKPQGIYPSTPPTFLDANANTGSEWVNLFKDNNFRHYLWFMDEEAPKLNLVKMFPYNKPEGISSVDFAVSSTGFSKKK